MEMGYSFVWIANTSPWLVSPDGDRIDLEVHGNIPSLTIGEVAEAVLVAKAAPRILTTKADPDESEDEYCAPAKVKQYAGCTNAKSALALKASVVILDSDEEVSDANSSEGLESANSSDNDEGAI